MNFKVGDVVIVNDPRLECYGLEGVVLADLCFGRRHGKDGHVEFGHFHTVEVAGKRTGFDGRDLGFKPIELRRKDYDGNQAIGWENSVWQPKQVQA